MARCSFNNLLMIHRLCNYYISVTQPCIISNAVVFPLHADDDFDVIGQAQTPTVCLLCRSMKMFNFFKELTATRPLVVVRLGTLWDAKTTERAVVEGSLKGLLHLLAI